MGISAEEEPIEEERIWEECFRGDILDKFGNVLSLSWVFGEDFICVLSNWFLQLGNLICQVHMILWRQQTLGGSSIRSEYVEVWGTKHSCCDEYLQPCYPRSWLCHVHDSQGLQFPFLEFQFFLFTHISYYMKFSLKSTLSSFFILLIDWMQHPIKSQCRPLHCFIMLFY